METKFSRRDNLSREKKKAQDTDFNETLKSC